MAWQPSNRRKQMLYCWLLKWVTVKDEMKSNTQIELHEQALSYLIEMVKTCGCN